MQRNVGIWIDHKQALVLQVENGKRNLQVIESHIEPVLRFPRRGVGSEDLPTEVHADHRYQEHLKAFYEQIKSTLQAADSILILGPGEAKLELQKTLSRSKVLRTRIAGIETADKMSPRQLAAKVRQFFAA